MISLFAAAPFAMAGVEKVPGPWTVSGSFILLFIYGGTWNHDINLINGTGGYPAGADPYSISETVSNVAIDGNNISFH